MAPHGVGHSLSRIGKSVLATSGLCLVHKAYHDKTYSLCQNAYYSNSDKFQAIHAARAVALSSY